MSDWQREKCGGGPSSAIAWGSAATVEALTAGILVVVTNPSNRCAHD